MYRRAPVLQSRLKCQITVSRTSSGRDPTFLCFRPVMSHASITCTRALHGVNPVQGSIQAVCPAPEIVSELAQLGNADAAKSNIINASPPGWHGPRDNHRGTGLHNLL